MNTAPQPALPWEGPGSAQPTDGRPAAGDRESGRGTRIVESIGGLFGAGLLALGVVLLILQLVAPAVVSGATGPGWGAVAAHLAVGAAAESVRVARHRLPVPARIVAAVLTVAAAIAVLAFCWWL